MTKESRFWFSHLRNIVCCLPPPTQERHNKHVKQHVLKMVLEIFELEKYAVFSNNKLEHSLLVCFSEFWAGHNMD